MESLSSYYPWDESGTDEDELIWGRYTGEQWENMTCAQRADAIWACVDSKAGENDGRN